MAWRDFPAANRVMKSLFQHSIDRNWRGAIPATFIYDANGLLAKKFIAPQSFETFAAALRPLLQK